MLRGTSSRACQSETKGAARGQSQGPQHQGCASVGKFKWMLQDPLSLIGGLGCDDEQMGMKRREVSVCVAFDGHMDI